MFLLFLNILSGSRVGPRESGGQYFDQKDLVVFKLRLVSKISRTYSLGGDEHYRLQQTARL
jgi:hypothetical protein